MPLLKNNVLVADTWINTEAEGELPAAGAALTNILTLFPYGFHADRALLLVGGEASRRGNPVQARELFQAFLSC